MISKDRRGGKDRRRTEPISHDNIRVAVSLNIAGLALMSLSMFVYNPMYFVITFILGGIFLAGGFVAWLILVVREAMSKGLFE